MKPENKNRAVSKGGARADGPASTLRVVVHPGARREEVGPDTERGLKVSVFAPPDKGKANRAVLDLLAKWLDLPRRNLNLLRGKKSRRKEIAIEGLDAKQLQTRLKGLDG